METSQSFEHVAKALVAAYPELHDLKKTITNTFGGYNYASLDQLTALIRPILSKNGLIAIQDFSFAGEDMVGINTFLIHESGQWISSGPLFLRVEERKGMSHAQAVGSTVTYGRRYSLSAFLGLASEEDNDASGEKDEKRQTARSREDAVRSRRYPRRGDPEHGVSEREEERDTFSPPDDDMME